MSACAGPRVLVLLHPDVQNSCDSVCHSNHERVVITFASYGYSLLDSCDASSIWNQWLEKLLF